MASQGRLPGLVESSNVVRFSSYRVFEKPSRSNQEIEFALISVLRVLLKRI